jgi:hypothetical protein
MKRALLVLLLLSLALAGSLAAADPGDDLLDLARYVPADADLFAAIRTDDASLAELEDLINGLLVQLPPEVLADADYPVTLRSSIGEPLIGNTPMARYLVKNAGDAIGFAGFLTFDDLTVDDPAMILVHLGPDFDIDAFVEVGGLRLTGQSGPFALYGSPGDDQSVIGFGDGLMVSTIAMPFPDIDDGQMLVDQPTFTSLANALPAPDYGALLWLDPTSAIAADPDWPAGLALAPLMIGATLADGDTGIIDTATSAGAAAATTYAPVDREFLRWVPASANTVFVGSDLAGRYGDLVARLGEIDRDAATQVRFLPAMVGLQIERDVLPWATGHYAGFLTIGDDLLATALMDSAATPDLSDLAFGLIIETTDAEAAAEAARRLASGLAILAANEESISTRDEIIAGMNATVFTLSDPMLTLEIAIGANDSIFYIGSRSVLAGYVAGAPDLRAANLFGEAESHALPGADSLLYADGTGLVTITVVPSLVLVGPAISNVFEDVVDELGQQSSAPTTSRFVAQRQTDPSQQEEMEALLIALSWPRSATISTTAVDGVLLTRAALTLNVRPE